MEKGSEKEIIRKKVNNLQMIVNDNDQFIGCKRFGKDIIAVISPWSKLSDGNYSSEFMVPYNRHFRITNFYSTVGPAIGKYTVADGNITFDCVSKFTEEFFPKDAESGWIYFTSKTTMKNGEEYTEIDDKMVIEEIEPAAVELVQPDPIKFIVKANLKVFSFLMTNGFGFASIDKEKAVLWITLQDFSKLYCGVTNKVDLNNLIHNIMPVFPIFSVNISDKKSAVFLKLDGLKAFLNQGNIKKGLLRFEYSFKDTKRLHVCVIGSAELKDDAKEE